MQSRLGRLRELWDVFYHFLPEAALLLLLVEFVQGLDRAVAAHPADFGVIRHEKTPAF